MNAQHDPGPPGELPPSAKYVRYVLDDHAPLTQAELIELTGLPSRTVRHALDRLDDIDAVIDEHKPGDARQRLYRLKE
jgi:hypothetical protein